MPDRDSSWEDLPLPYRVMYGSPEEYQRRRAAVPTPSRSGTRSVPNLAAIVIGSLVGIGLFVAAMALLGNAQSRPGGTPPSPAPHGISRTVTPPQQTGGRSGICVLPQFWPTALCQ